MRPRPQKVCYRTPTAYTAVQWGHTTPTRRGAESPSVLISQIQLGIIMKLGKNKLINRCRRSIGVVGLWRCCELLYLSKSRAARSVIQWNYDEPEFKCANRSQADYRTTIAFFSGLFLTALTRSSCAVHTERSAWSQVHPSNGDLCYRRGDSVATSDDRQYCNDFRCLLTPKPSTSRNSHLPASRRLRPLQNGTPHGRGPAAR